MADPAAPPADPAAPPPAAPWHAGIEPETLGFWQNKGYKLDDPKALATELTKQYRAAEQHIGAPPDQILRMPKADAPEADVKAFWGRLGAPGDAKDYDFSAVKMSDGKDVPPAFFDSMRAAFSAAFVPKEKATAIATAVVKYAETERAARDAINQGLLKEQKDALDKNWGPNKDFHKLQMTNGARRLGLTEAEAIAIAEAAAVSGASKFDRVVEMFRKVGANTAEDTWHEGGGGPGGNPTTREGAQATLNEKMADPAWGKRLTAGDVATVNEWRALTTQIDGESRAA